MNTVENVRDIRVEEKFESRIGKELIKKIYIFNTKKKKRKREYIQRR